MNNIANFISQAKSNGFSSNAILGFITSTNQKAKSFANDAIRAKYTADTILGFLQRFDEKEDNQVRTSEEKTRKQDKKNKSKANKNLAATALAAANVGLLGYGLYRQAGKAALNASTTATQRLLGGPTTRPRLPGPSPRTPPPTPRGQALALPAPGKQAPASKAPIAPRGTPLTPNPVINPPVPGGQVTNLPTNRMGGVQVATLVKNLKVENQLDTLFRNGFDVATAASALKSLVPKQTYELLKQQPGGLENVIESYFNEAQSRPAEESFSERVKRESSNRVIQTAPPETEAASNQDTITSDDFLPQAPQVNYNPNLDVKQKTQDATFGREPIKKLSEFPALEKSRFAIASYQKPGENDKDFKERLALEKAVNKTAKSLAEGLSFADIANEKRKKGETIPQLSTSADILRFLAGIPNVYDDLLTDEDKQELTDALLESGQMENEGLRPSQLGERNIHGAHLIKDNIWNLLVLHEPNISKIRPKSVKGSNTLKSGQMGATEFRRFMAHNVHAVLSGKTITTELADKINKISKSVEFMDTLVTAMNQGKLATAQKEMEKMMDDEYFLSLFEKELDELLMTPEQAEKTRQLQEEDAKMAASIKASMTRKKNKSKKTNEN